MHNPGDGHRGDASAGSNILNRNKRAGGCHNALWRLFAAWSDASEGSIGSSRPWCQPQCVFMPLALIQGVRLATVEEIPCFHAALTQWAERL